MITLIFLLILAIAFGLIAAPLIANHCRSCALFIYVDDWLYSVVIRNQNLPCFLCTCCVLLLAPYYSQIHQSKNIIS